ncbi:hypothetical protein BURC_04806 [Burkholderiaceae bacterium]|nr:hypothetical protein BURC_04806 [Burkholderiaceae bacterium]
MNRSTPTGDEGRGLYKQLLRDERRHQFYSRALGWVMALLLAAIFVLGLMAAIKQAPGQPDCRDASGPSPQAIAPIRLELSREPTDVRLLLRGPHAVVYPTTRPYAEAMCVEARIARHRELLGLDGAVFIPLYLLLGLAALAWHYVLALRSRGCDRARRDRVPHALIAWLVASAAVLGVTAWLDAAENSAAHAVLDLAAGGLATSDIDTADWRAAVTAAHDASVAKWAALAAWAATLAMLAGLRRRSLSLPRGSERRRRWSSGIAWLMLVSALVATVTLGAGAALAGGAGAEPANAFARVLLGIGFAAVFGHAGVLFVLHRLHLPPRLVLLSPPDAPPGVERRSTRRRRTDPPVRDR